MISSYLFLPTTIPYPTFTMAVACFALTLTIPNQFLNTTRARLLHDAVQKLCQRASRIVPAPFWAIYLEILATHFLDYSYSSIYFFLFLFSFVSLIRKRDLFSFGRIDYLKYSFNLYIEQIIIYIISSHFIYLKYVLRVMEN